MGSAALFAQWNNLEIAMGVTMVGIKSLLHDVGMIASILKNSTLSSNFHHSYTKMGSKISRTLTNTYQAWAGEISLFYFVYPPKRIQEADHQTEADSECTQ